MLLILIITAAGIYFTTKEPLRLMGECYRDAELLERTKASRELNFDNVKDLCTERKESIPLIRECMRQVQIYHPVASELLRVAALVKPELRPEYATELHNRSCIEYPDTLLE